ncbi:MAG: DUF6288 domain-containing protein [Verrucomicrobiota bacterium]
MKNQSVWRPSMAALLLALLLALPAWVRAAPPDLTATGVIATISTTLTYNLGPTGLRGWIYISSGSPGQDGLITDESRQILVTVVGSGTPAATILAVNDVILGVGWGSGTDTLPLFTSDARKSFGRAIGEAEKIANNGVLRLKRWRAGVTTDVSITLPVMGSYTDTAPYNCPKSTQILANARNLLVSQLLASQTYLTNDYGGAIKGLALLGGVTPADTNYPAVQTRLQTFARALAPTTLSLTGCDTWNWGYIGVFLSEYYLNSLANGTPDANVLHGINEYTVALAKAQSRYGTFGHGGSLLKTDGSLHGTIPPYGPVNQAGLPANIAIVMGKKALVAAAQPIDPEIDPAIQRGSDFFAFYVNKGPIPYGEHAPYMQGHASNGKDALCAVLFGLQDTRVTETEYFTRMTTAGCTGREYGHTGQGFSYLWGALGSNMGGAAAVAAYLQQVRWHLDLERRSDGSFVYDGGEQFGAGSTADGTYLGASAYYSVNPTASYILTYALPLQRLYITGKNPNPANTLDATKVANAIAAATFKLNCTSYTSTQLIAALSEFDPVVRNYAAIQLATLTLTTAELNTLTAMVTGSDPNGRMGACQTLGILKNSAALPLISGRLSDSDLWVRAMAANALRSYGSTANSQLTTMLNAFTANATDPDVIVWSDPVQIANGFLSFELFGDAVYGGNNVASSTINASKSLLYPAVKAGLKQPDSNPRYGVASFCNSYLTLADVQALTPDLIECVTSESQADTMWSMDPRGSAIATLAKNKVAETIPLALAMQAVPTGFGWGADGFQVPGLNALKAFGDSARWTLPALRALLLTWDTTSSKYTTLNSTIANIEAAITSPTGITNVLAVATPQVLATTAAKAITLTGTSPRSAVTFTNVTAPAHGTLTGTAPNLIYTPATGYSGPDYFTFQTVDSLTTSNPGTVSLIVGSAGAGLKGEYFDNMDFTNLKFTRTDAQVNFDWGTGSPDPSIAVGTFSVRWSGLLLVPETGTYTFSTLNSDGVRLYVNGAALIDDFIDQTTNWKDGATVNLTAGQRVDLQMLYYKNTGSAAAKLKWTGPSFAGANGAIIAKEWLYDGTGVTNRTPYAHAQIVTLVQNTAQPITLTGSGANLGLLTYSLVSQPAHGLLSGSGANLTYTPAAGFNGTDSFSFLVNDGTSNSTPATVSISIWAGLPVSYFWTNAVAGNWSGSSNWTDAAGAAAMPTATGQAFYSLNFNKAGTYIVTHDLNNGYVFNQLNVAGAVTFTGTNSLSPAGNGPLLPQINQNSINAVVFSTPFNLAAMTTMGGTGGGAVTISSVIAGTGGLSKDSPGTLSINNVTNTYSGGTIINNGTISLALQANQALGSGPVTINSGGTLMMERVTASNPLTLNGGTIIANNGFGDGFTGSVSLLSSSTINTAYNMTFSGSVSGAGGFIKTGNNTLNLTGTNSFSGPTRIVAGTLACTKAAALGSGPIDITTGAKLNLNYSGTHVVAALTYNAGAAMAPGTYGSSASPAAIKNDSYFTSTSIGTLTILPTTSTALALTTGSSPANPGSPLTFTATVSGATPTGSVAFYAGSTLLGSGTLNAAFQASLTTSSLAIGSYSITAQYTGNATNAASTSAALAIDITSMLAAVPANLIATPSSNSVTLTWSASAGATGYNVKRSLTSGGTFGFLAIASGAGYTDLTAVNGTTYYYAVSATNAAGESANSSPVSAVPALLVSTTTVASSLGASGTYGAVTFTATVTPGASGTVTFKDGTTVLGTGPLASGQATCAATALALGSHTITAIFPGDGTYAPSTSTIFSYMVTAKPLTLGPLTAADKVYDQTATATLSSGILGSGVVAGETVMVVAGSGAFSDANVGTNKAVTASGYSLGGANASNYVLAAQPSVANASITALPVVIGGSRVYDGTATIAGSALAISNKLSGDDLALTGNAALAAKDVGGQGIITSYATPVRVQSSTGSTGTSSATSFKVTLTSSPGVGNTLIAVISTRGSSAGSVSSISQTGATWSRVVQAANGSGTTTEIWIASNVPASTATALTINQASLRSAAVVMEYSGILSASPVDQTASTTGSSTAAVTGTTTATTQANELWVGGIGIADGRRTLNSPYGSSFTVVAFPKSGTTSSDAMIYALEKIVNASGSASSGGSVSNSDAWAGAIATFKAAVSSGLALTGAAASNYTLSQPAGLIATITPLPVTVAAVSASKTYDRTTSAAGIPTLTPALATGDTTRILGQAFQDAGAGVGNKVIVPSIIINDGNGGANYALSLINFATGTITKAQAVVTLGNLAYSYDGTPKAATATTDPAGLSVTLNYDGVVTQPSAPGSYAVLATVSDLNYTGTAGATLVIAPEPIVDWRAAHFTAAEIRAGLADDSVDANGDGLSNLTKYTLGIDPRIFSAQPLAIVPAAANQYTLTFIARPASGAGYTGLTRKYDVENSPNPANPTLWLPVDGYTHIVGAGQTVTVTLPVTSTSRFYRLNVRLE